MEFSYISPTTGEYVTIETEELLDPVKEGIEVLLELLSHYEEEAIESEIREELLSQQIHYQGLILHAHSQEAKN